MWRWFLQRRLLCSISSLCATWWLICCPKSSANSPHVQKCGSSEILKRVADPRKSSMHMCPLWKSGRNSRQVCWRQQRRCVAQQSPHRWWRETWWWNKEVDDASIAKRKLSKHGTLANAHEHHITLPSASLDVWCTMHATKQTRWSMKALTTSCLISSASPTRWGIKRMLML